MALFTVLVMGFLWSLFDLIRKKSLKYFNEYEILLVVITSQLALFSYSLVFSDLIVNNIEYFFYYLPLVAMGLIAFYSFLKALKSSEISLVIPMLSFTPLFSSIYAYSILEEKMSVANYIGIIVVIVGSLILYSKSLSIRNLFFSPLVLIRNANARLMLLVSLIWSLTPVLDKKCLSYTDIYFHGFLQSAGWIVAFPLILMKSKVSIKKMFEKKTGYLIFSIALIGSAVSIIQLFALTINLVPVLESFKRSIGIILAIAFGYFFFKEKVNFKKILSVIVMVVGLNLLLD